MAVKIDRLIGSLVLGLLSFLFAIPIFNLIGLILSAVSYYNSFEGVRGRVKGPASFITILGILLIALSFNYLGAVNTIAVLQLYPYPYYFIHEFLPPKSVRVWVPAKGVAMGLKLRKLLRPGCLIMVKGRIPSEVSPALIAFDPSGGEIATGFEHNFTRSFPPYFHRYYLKITSPHTYSLVEVKWRIFSGAMEVDEGTVNLTIPEGRERVFFIPSSPLHPFSWLGPNGHPGHPYETWVYVKVLYGGPCTFMLDVDCAGTALVSGGIKPLPFTISSLPPLYKITGEYFLFRGIEDSTYIFVIDPIELGLNLTTFYKTVGWVPYALIFENRGDSDVEVEASVSSYEIIALRYHPELWRSLALGMENSTFKVLSAILGSFIILATSISCAMGRPLGPLSPKPSKLRFIGEALCYYFFYIGSAGMLLSFIFHGHFYDFYTSLRSLPICSWLIYEVYLWALRRGTLTPRL